VGVADRVLTFWRGKGGMLDTVVGDSRRRIGEGTSTTRALSGSELPSSLRDRDSPVVEPESFWSLPLKPKSNKRRATEGGTESLSTSKSGLGPSEWSASTGVATTFTGTSGASTSACAAGGHFPERTTHGCPNRLGRGRMLVVRSSRCSAPEPISLCCSVP